jgi:hypothetical protein
VLFVRVHVHVHVHVHVRVHVHVHGRVHGRVHVRVRVRVQDDDGTPLGYMGESLLWRLLRWDPQERISARDALKHHAYLRPEGAYVRTRSSLISHPSPWVFFFWCVWVFVWVCVHACVRVCVWVRGPCTWMHVHVRGAIPAQSGGSCESPRDCTQ